MYAELQKDIHLSDIKKENFFIHGSKVNGGQMNTESDIDFCIFQEDIFDPLRKIYKKEIDFSNAYLSFSKNFHGQRLSFHLSEPSFRKNYSSSSISYELRPRDNIKKNKKNSYLLPFTNYQREVCLTNIICPQYCLNENMFVNIIPQTGFYFLDKDKLISDNFSFNVTDVYKKNKDKGVMEKIPFFQDNIFILGLEINKCLSELSIENKKEQDITKISLLKTFSIFHKILSEKDKNKNTNHILELLLNNAKVINQISKRNKYPESFLKLQHSRIYNCL